MNEELYSVMCYDCGINFYIKNECKDLWKRNQKVFYCPNGHRIRFIQPEEDIKGKELVSLRLENKELQSKLDDSLKKIGELELEVEIWNPSRKSKDPD